MERFCFEDIGPESFSTTIIIIGPRYCRVLGRTDSLQNIFFFTHIGNFQDTPHESWARIELHTTSSRSEAELPAIDFLLPSQNGV